MVQGEHCVDLENCIKNERALAKLGVAYKEPIFVKQLLSEIQWSIRFQDSIIFLGRLDRRAALPGAAGPPGGARKLELLGRGRPQAPLGSALAAGYPQARRLSARLLRIFSLSLLKRPAAYVETFSVVCFDDTLQV